MEVRFHMGLNTIMTELRVRRLGWMQDMLRWPGHNSQLRAALAGRLWIPEGEVGGMYVPWMEQLADDVEWIEFISPDCTSWSSQGRQQRWLDPPPKNK